MPHRRGEAGTRGAARRAKAHVNRGRPVARKMNNTDGVRVQTRFVAVLTLACFAPVAVGCVSHEYVIPKQELRRLVDVPPHQRGERVQVVQDVGSRRANAVEANPEAWERDTYAQVYIDGYIQIPAGNVGSSGPYAGGVARAAPRGGGAQPAGWRAPATGGNWKTPGGGGAAPSNGGGGSGGGWRAPSPAGGGSSSGGGGKGEALIVIAVVLVAMAAVVGVGLVASEGVRYDGPAEMWAGQPVYLKDERGGETVVALGDITPDHLATTVEAKVKDDEGYGLHLLGHQPVDRNMSPVLKLEGGSVVVDQGGSIASALTVSARGGLFVRPWLGLLLTASTGSSLGGVNPTVGPHSLGFEVQSLPLHAGMFHLGGYANVGAGAASITQSEWATVFGGGVLAELDITGRMALTLRAGANNFYYVDTGFSSPAATFTAGVAIY
jgi:hypothetical protein